MREKNDVPLTEKKEAGTLENSLTSLVGTLYSNGLGPGYMSEQLSQTTTLSLNLRWYLLSNNRNLLSQLYVEHGIVQTLVDQPVADGFRAGFEIKSSQLDGNDIEKMQVFCERYRVVQAIIHAIQWARLYGGGAVLIITDEDPSTPLNISKIGPDTPLAFRGVDMWELYYDNLNLAQWAVIDDEPLENGNDEYYNYYGYKVHPSRVYRIEGKEAPSFIRPRLRGWGMSEVERVVRSINQYLKNQDVVFALLDEAKVDVFKMKGFNSALMTAGGTSQVSRRIQHANVLKNYNNALTMDMDDDYIQKEISFSGLAEVLVQIRQGVAADLKMPVTKLFGISAAGFNSGEDDIENYNSMIESEVRAKSKFIVVDMLRIVCQKLFGFYPDDLMIEFNPLRILNAKEEEEVKNHQFNRTMSATQAGMMDAQEFKEAMNKDSLLPIELDETKEALPPLNGDFMATSSENVGS